MAFESAFAQAFLYLAAALVAIVVGKRFGLGAVLGYLIAGALIGPWGLGWIGREGEQVTHFAEFGVVMMLFIILMAMIILVLMDEVHHHVDGHDHDHDHDYYDGDCDEGDDDQDDGDDGDDDEWR